MRNKRTCRIIERAAGACLAVSPAGTLHVLDWEEPYCKTNNWERPVKGRQKAKTEYTPLSAEEVRAEKWNEVCARCSMHPDYNGLLQVAAGSE